MKIGIEFKKKWPFKKNAEILILLEFFDKMLKTYPILSENYIISINFGTIPILVVLFRNILT